MLDQLLDLPSVMKQLRLWMTGEQKVLSILTLARLFTQPFTAYLYLRVMVWMSSYNLVTAQTNR